MECELVAAGFEYGTGICGIFKPVPGVFMPGIWLTGDGTTVCGVVGWVGVETGEGCGRGGNGTCTEVGTGFESVGCGLTFVVTVCDCTVCDNDG